MMRFISAFSLSLMLSSSGFAFDKESAVKATVGTVLVALGASGVGTTLSLGRQTLTLCNSKTDLALCCHLELSHESRIVGSCENSSNACWNTSACVSSNGTVYFPHAKTYAKPWYTGVMIASCMTVVAGMLTVWSVHCPCLS